MICPILSDKLYSSDVSDSLSKLECYEIHRVDRLRQQGARGCNLVGANNVHLFANTFRSEFQEHKFHFSLLLTNRITSVSFPNGLALNNDAFQTAGSAVLIHSE